MSAKPKLTYFNFPGRGEPIRLAFKIGGREFEDHRVEFKDWPALKANTPWGSMPVLEIDGKTIAQSNNILRFVGRRVGLYPTNYPAEEFSMAQIDELMDAVEDMAHALTPTFQMPEAERIAKRKELLAGPINSYLEKFEKRIHANGGKFFVGSSLTVADLKILQTLRWFSGGSLDGFPTTVLEKFPHLAAFKEHHAALKY